MPTDPRSAGVPGLTRTIDAALAVLTIEWTGGWARAWPGFVEGEDGDGVIYLRLGDGLTFDVLALPGEILAELVAWATRAAHAPIDFGGYPS